MISPNTGHIHSSFDMEVMMWWMEAGTRWTYMYMTIYRNVNCDASIQAVLANSSRHVLLRSCIIIEEVISSLCIIM